ncbi:hypothetical protein C8Q76DRAFT_738832 [Earliella scabrosa]|nr:hypothetical protein C8Q76DRAFT_738832 [Earliella scabrosa]
MSESDTVPTTSMAKDVIEDPTTSTAEDIPAASPPEDENPTTYTAEDILENTNAVYRSGDILMIGALPSRFDRPMTFAQDEQFANVIGSSGDRRVDHLAWLKLWERTFQTKPTKCSSYGYPESRTGTPFPCSDRLVGGHVVMGTKAKWVPPGSNEVYIIPICQRHNNNNEVHMAAITERRAVKLKDYHDP